MRELIEVLGENVTVVVIIAIGSVMLIGTVMRHLSAMFIASAREKSRREIAAYIAEGSISPDQGERLIKVDVNNDRGKVASPFA